MTMTPEMLARATEVADALNGTAQSMSAVATEEECNNIEFCSAVDDITMQCETCGWFVDADDVDDECVCSECVRDA